jgi:hypothetical protein
MKLSFNLRDIDLQLRLLAPDKIRKSIAKTEQYSGLKSYF